MGLHAAHAGLNRNLSLANARRNGQSDLIETSPLEPDESRFDENVIDVKVDGVVNWRSARERLPGRDGGSSRSEPDTENLNGVARLSGHGAITARSAGGAEDVVSPSTVGSRTVGPENDSIHKLFAEQEERRCGLTQGHGRSRDAGGSGDDNGDRTTDRRLRRHLQVNLGGAYKGKISRFPVNGHAGSAERSRKIAIPGGGFPGEVVPVNRHPFAGLNDARCAEHRNHSSWINGRGVHLASSLKCRGAVTQEALSLPGHD